MKRHLRTCSRATKLKYPGGVYVAPPTIFEELATFDILVPKKNQFYPFFAVYDFEAILEKLPDRVTEKQTWLTKHVPISVSICSNVPEYEQARCFISPDGKTLTTLMVDYLLEIAVASEQLVKEKWREVLKEIEEMEKRWKPDEIFEETTQEVEAMETNEIEPPSERFLSAICKQNTDDFKID